MSCWKEFSEINWLNAPDSAIGAELLNSMSDECAAVDSAPPADPRSADGRA
jgi:hypothetical protein